MKKKIFFILIALITVLAACSNSEADTKEEEDLPELSVLEVDFDVPEHVEVGETIDLTAHVSFEGEPVEDAHEVLFEVWTQGNSDDSVELEGVHQENGTYTASFTFEEEAVYEMYAHTTAKEQHVMPLETVIAGDAEPSEEDAHDEMDHEHHEHDEDEHGEHHEHDNDENE
ncbi:FixH family protein [Oceanobacillus sojae]|uniref:FixH family protein n=1 Tax=Oceanobacillus sojae TaxID=582851 RepID=UPI0021A6CD76|nr:FixH family protein [Oceanobacillus sojae]MCT1902341.1 FixH family protein [Oceanobacillus sojae]